MSSQAPVDYLPPGISIFGGLPTRTPDLAPSIVFIVAYALLLPLAAFRIANARSRTWILMRPTLFVLIRIAAFAIRAVQANGTYSAGLFIAELVLVISGFNIICEPLVRVLEQNLHASAYNAGVEEPGLVIRLLRLMRIGLLVSLILGIYTGTQYNDTLTPSQVSTLDTYRLATSGLNLGIVGLTIVLSALLHRQYACTVRGSAFVVLVGCLLIVPSAYRLAAVVNPEPVLALRTKIYFYVLGSLFEFLGTLPFFAVNLHDVLDLDYKHPGSGGPIGRIISAIRPKSTHQNHAPYGPGGTRTHHAADMEQHVGYGASARPTATSEASYGDQHYYK